MVTLDVLSLLEKKGKTKYWLYHQLGMSYQNFSRMVNNETKSAAVLPSLAPHGVGRGCEW